MGLMDDAMRSDAEFTADTDQASELVDYVSAEYQTIKPIRVIINRLDSQNDIAVGGMPSREFEVWIPYSDDHGLTSKPIEGDTIEVKDDYADDAQSFITLDRILESDAGGWLCRFV